MELDIIKQSMYRHIRAQNKYLTKEYLDTLTPMELLANCNPLNRQGYATLLVRQGAITNKDADKFERETLGR